MAMYQEARGMLTEPAAVAPLTEGAAGIAVIVLCIIGLGATAAASMASISVIIIGAGLLIEAANTAIEYGRTVSGNAVGEVAEAGADMMVECMAGGTGIVLGILALIGINAAHLAPAALIVFGAALLLAGASATRIGTVGMTESGAARTVSWRSELAPSRGLQMLIGVAAVVLGILAFVITANTAVLLLVGLLVVGAALLATSANFTRAMLTTFAQ